MWGAAAVVLAALLTVGGSAAHIAAASSGHEFGMDDVPPRDVAIVLGARVYADGTPSPFLAARLDLGARLFREGKVRAILVSGANTADSHHETDVMAAWLVDHGVPAGRIVADPKGFDTSDTCVRAAKVYGVRSAVLVSQGYHLGRALTLCRARGIDAVAVGDYSPRDRGSAYWTEGVLREWLAGPKMELDLLFADSSDPYDPSLDLALGR